jgi:hypothetical protein
VPLEVRDEVTGGRMRQQPDEDGFILSLEENTIA